MDTLQAVALSIKLRHLERWTRARRQRALHYDALFAERGAAREVLALPLYPELDLDAIERIVGLVTKTLSDGPRA